MNEVSAINRFAVASNRISQHEDYEPPTSDAPYGYFKGRHIIGESTPINGGVFISALPYEAIVVDTKYEQLSSAYTEMLTEFAKDFGTSRHLEHKVMKYVLDNVKKKVSYAPKSVASLLASKNVTPDTKTSLTFFIDHGIGSARHQILLYGYFIERLIKADYIAGKLKIRKKIDINTEEDEAIHYTAPNGQSYSFTPSDQSPS